MTKVVIIGGGISGLASAYFLSGKIEPGEITVIESSDRFGGTILDTSFGERRVETGPDSFITRIPSALDLIDELGLSDHLISPATSSAYIYSRSKLHPIPAGTVFGAPSNFQKFLGNSLVSRSGQIRAALELLLGRAKVEGDTTVGSFCKKRWGREVTENLIDPLVGGIHAGNVYQLSLAECAPQYINAAQASRSVSQGLKNQMANYTSSGKPAFYSLDGGLSDLIDALVRVLRQRGVVLTASSESIEILPLSSGYRITTKDGALEAEGVICATPAYITASLVRPVSAKASDLLATVDYASPIMTLLAYPDSAFPEPLQGSGVLIPHANRTLSTAITFASNKWPGWKTEGETILRVSAGRFGDTRAWDFSDDALIANLETEMATILGTRTGSIRSEVFKWHKRIPQFKPFHAQLIQRIRENIPSSMELAGAPYNGVGIPACISSGALAADRLFASLSSPR